VRHVGVDHDIVVGGRVASSEGAARTPSDAPGARRPVAVRADVLGVLWVLAAAGLVLVRALRPGMSLGPFDLLSRFGLTSQPGVAVHNAIQADQIQQFVPWMNLAWHQVHGGHLPLWNPDNVLGVPLAFNWQSSVFSLPTVVGYLVPVSYAYTAMVLGKLVIAGTGAYVLCRVLGTGALGAAMGGTAFELSGAMVVHAGWPHTSVTCWGGWALAALVMVVRGRRRMWSALLLTVSVAMAVYGGHPESLVVMGVAVAVFVVVYLVARARLGGGAVMRPVRDMVLAIVGGLALGAPLLLPGVQLGVLSSRNSGTPAPAFPLSHLPNVLGPGLQGNDFRTAAYVGVVVLVMALVAARVSWRRPEVPALVAVAAVSALLTFVSVADKLMHLVPGGKTVAWSRSVMLLALALAVLAALGVDALVKAPADRVALRWLAAGFGGAGLVVGALAVAGALGAAPAVARHDTSLVWPAAQAGGGLAVAGALWWGRRSRHGRRTPRPAGAVSVLLALETAFLLSAGVPFWSVSSSYFAPNPAITALQQRVGDSLVGYGSCRSLRYLTASPNEVGIRPDANIGYGLHELAVYDPILPESYFRSWLAVSGQRTPPSLQQLGVFCAHIVTVYQARAFGVQYVLEPPHHRLFGGGKPVAVVGGESLYAIPGAAQAVRITRRPAGVAVPTEATGSPLPVTHADDAAWRVVVDGPSAAIVRFHLTDVPGWQASLDGRPLALHPWADSTMLEASVPPGHHVITLRYWPVAFTVGLVVAGAVVVCFAALGIVVALRGRRRAAPTP